MVSVALQRVWPSNALEQGPDSDAPSGESTNTEIHLRPSLASAANRRTFAKIRTGAAAGTMLRQSQNRKVARHGRCADRRRKSRCHSSPRSLIANLVDLPALSTDGPLGLTRYVSDPRNVDTLELRPSSRASSANQRLSRSLVNRFARVTVLKAVVRPRSASEFVDGSSPICRANDKPS